VTGRGGGSGGRAGRVTGQVLALDGTTGAHTVLNLGMTDAVR